MNRNLKNKIDVFSFFMAVGIVIYHANASVFIQKISVMQSITDITFDIINSVCTSLKK